MPSYLKLYESGELSERVKLLMDKLENCNVCPRNCAVNRFKIKTGYCQSGEKALICSYGDHHGEESPLSGTKGSGTIFFGSCNLRCVFCQNADISQNPKYPTQYERTPERIASIMLHLQNERRCHNINFVSPSHFVPQIIAALEIALSRGLNIPLIYNSNGYDSLETLQLLDGIIDIYLPDLKYSDDLFANKYSAALNYTETARIAIKEMYRQVGNLQADDKGIAEKGLIIRHLVLPNNISGSIETLHWIANELSDEVSVNVMAQYHPAHHAVKIESLARSISVNEYNKVLEELFRLKFKNAMYQPMPFAVKYRR